MLFTQKCGEIFAQRVKPDIFGWNQAFVTYGLLPPAGGAPDIDPIGGLVASALVALIFHKGLQQYGLKTIALLPILWELTGRQRKYL